MLVPSTQNCIFCGHQQDVSRDTVECAGERFAQVPHQEQQWGAHFIEDDETLLRGQAFPLPGYPDSPSLGQPFSNFTPSVVYTSKLLNIPKTQIQPWTDSSIVLSWLRKPPHSITEVFVRNRISTIQDSLPDSLWRHVPTKSNPADLASRGHNCSRTYFFYLVVVGPCLAQLLREQLAYS